MYDQFGLTYQKNMSTLDVNILHPCPECEKHMNKKKTLVPNPKSEFLSLRCSSCMTVTTAYSHSNVPVVCKDCNTPLAFPTGGRIRLIESVEARPKINA